MSLINKEVSKESTEADPCVEVYRQDGSYSGLAFHGVPGGHEFTSFVLGLHNAAGVGQKIDDDIGAQKMASLNENITAEMHTYKKP